MNYTYMVRCADGSLYTGWTTDLEKRIRSHNSGRGAKYTRSRLPVHLVYAESFAEKEEAMRREAAIKKLSREEKEKLIEACTAPVKENTPSAAESRSKKARADL